MESSGLPNHPKIWGKIDQNIDAGNYSLVVFVNHDTDNYTGYRSFILTTDPNSGTQSIVSAVAFFVMSVSILVVMLWVCDHSFYRKVKLI